MDSSASGNRKHDRLLQRELSNMLIKRWNHWKSSTACMPWLLKGWQIRMDTYNTWWAMGKVGGEKSREVNVRDASEILNGICSCAVIC